LDFARWPCRQSIADHLAAQDCAVRPWAGGRGLCACVGSPDPGAAAGRGQHSDRWAL